MIPKPEWSKFRCDSFPLFQRSKGQNFTGLRLMPPALLVKNLSFLRSQLFSHCQKNRGGNLSNINRKSIQFQPKINQNSSLDRSLWGYGGSWLASWRPGSTLAGIGPPPTLQMEPCWAQVGAMLGPSWNILESKVWFWRSGKARLIQVEIGINVRRILKPKQGGLRVIPYCKY